MKINLSPSAYLACRLKVLLAAAPVKAGMRLLPERELAQKLGLGKKCVNIALETLNDEGLLSKRRGSGSYVRKIPAGFNFAIGVDDVLKPSDIFPEFELEENQAQRLNSLPQQQRLKIQLWSGFHRPGNSNYSMYQRIREQIVNAGHCLQEKDITDSENHPRSCEEIAIELKENTADGYLVSSPLGSLFQKAYLKAFNREPWHIIYVSTWGYDLRLEPTIRQEGYEAIIRAIRKIYEEGARKIAYIGIDTEYHSGDFDRHFYELAVRMLGLEYSCSRHVACNEEAAYRAALEMFTQDPPDGIFVADDHLVHGVRRALDEFGFEPGSDVACIALSNSDKAMEINVEWTSIDFNRDLVGALAADELLKSMLIAGTELRSLSLLGKWLLHDSHTLRKKQKSS